MFTIIFNKTDNRVFNIIAGEDYSDEAFAEAYGEDYKKLVVESLPEMKPMRQYLAVENDKVVVKDYELTEEQEKNIRSIELNQEINLYKEKLYATDYKAIKYAEGLYTEEEYYPIKAERQSYRDKINELEAFQNNL